MITNPGNVGSLRRTVQLRFSLCKAASAAAKELCSYGQALRFAKEIAEWTERGNSASETGPLECLRGQLETMIPRMRRSSGKPGRVFSVAKRAPKVSSSACSSRRQRSFVRGRRASPTNSARFPVPVTGPRESKGLLQSACSTTVDAPMRSGARDIARSLPFHHSLVRVRRETGKK
jgi:hypothetical protein